MRERFFVSRFSPTGTQRHGLLESRRGIPAAWCERDPPDMEANHAPSCYELGNQLTSGKHMPIDLEAARRAYETGCSNGFKPACARVADPKPPH